MSRIVEGIKELLKGKDDDDHKYRYRYDQRGAQGSKRYDGYPVEGRSGYPVEGRSGYSTEGRSGYPVEGRSGYLAKEHGGYPTEGRSGYPVEGRSGYPVEGRSGYPVDGRSSYPVTATIDGRSGYPVEGRSGYPVEGRSGYPAKERSGYPTEGRSGYPAEGRSDYSTDGRSGYPVTTTIDGRSGYATNSIPDGRSTYPIDGRSGYPTTATVDGRSGYSTNAIPEVRSSYPNDGRNVYAVEGRSDYPVSMTADGRSGYLADSLAKGRSAYPSEGRSGYSIEGHNGYPSDGRKGHPVNATTDGYQVSPRRQVVDDDYVRSNYDTRSEARGEFRQPHASSPHGSGQAYGIQDTSPRIDSKHRTTPHVEIPARGEYVNTIQPSPREYQSPASGRSMVEFMVPMCCDKCKEKVKEELSEVDGVDSVRCDPKNSRVIVTGHQFIDIERCLTKAERAVKKKCELVSNQAEGGTSNSRKVTSPSGYYETVVKTGILEPPPVINSRNSPSGRPTLARMPSFASGKVTQYDSVGPHGQDYEAKDYTSFRRMPSLGKSRHHEAEYISSYDDRLEPRASLNREFNAPIRRMPSFNRSRYHDAEYMAADNDRDYTPRSFYDNGSSYTASYNDRPSLLSQVSISKIPVENPNYVKQIVNY